MAVKFRITDPVHHISFGEEDFEVDEDSCIIVPSEMAEHFSSGRPDWTDLGSVPDPPSFRKVAAAAKTGEDRGQDQGPSRGDPTPNQPGLDLGSTGSRPEAGVSDSQPPRRGR